MIFELILLTGLLGFGAAAYLDLKTTEFPDWIPYAIILASLGIRSAAVLSGAPLSLLTSSLTTGLLLLGFGLLLYYLRQWGDGDAWLLGALGFVLPDTTGLPIPAPTLPIPFPLTLLLNFFLLSFVFIIIYSLAAGFHYRLYPAFFRSLKKEKASTSLIIILFLAASYTLLTATSLYSLPLSPLPFLLPLLIIPLLLFLKYALFLEQRVFHKSIPASQLRPGDVPASARWRVLHPHEYRTLKKSARPVQIKEGVRLAPAFLLTFLVTLFFGNVLALFL